MSEDPNADVPINGTLSVERILGPDVVRDWLARIAAAPKPETRPVEIEAGST